MVADWEYNKDEKREQNWAVTLLKYAYLRVLWTDPVKGRQLQVWYEESSSETQAADVVMNDEIESEVPCFHKLEQHWIDQKQSNYR